MASRIEPVPETNTASDMAATVPASVGDDPGSGSQFGDDVSHVFSSLGRVQTHPDPGGA